MSDFRVVLVPRNLQSDIDTAIEQAEKDQGFDLDPESRNSISNQLFCFFDEHGRLPEFTLRKKGGAA